MLKYLFMCFALAWSIQARAETLTPEYLNKVFDRVGTELDIPPKLLRAICYTESKFNPRAYNQSDGRGTNHAFGICQVLRETAEEYGFKDARCNQDFSDGVDSAGTLTLAARDYGHCKLFGVYTNVLYAGMYLKTKLVQYDGSWVEAISAYNMGTVKLCKRGVIRRLKDHSIIARCHKGKLANEAYVNRVLESLTTLETLELPK